MTYKLELFLIIQKKAQKYKIIKKLFFFFLWFIYVELFVFYTELTHLAQKIKNLD